MEAGEEEGTELENHGEMSFETLLPKPMRKAAKRFVEDEYIYRSYSLLAFSVIRFRSFWHLQSATLPY